MIRRISAKKLKSLGGKLPFSTAPRQQKEVRKKNPRRKAKEFARCYGSKARVLFVKGLPCVGCRVEGFSENAHIETDGMGRKADYTKIVPLCSHLSPNGSYGCHRRLHNVGVYRFQFLHDVDLTAEAEKVERAWQDHLTGESAK